MAIQGSLNSQSFKQWELARHERQEMSSKDSPRAKGSSPVRGSFILLNLFCSNTILASMPE